MRKRESERERERDERGREMRENSKGEDMNLDVEGRR
jgi:hypothetical protein